MRGTMETTDHPRLDIYTVGEGVADKTRLEFLVQLFRPTTLALLDRIAIKLGMVCLDAGCGTGDITFELARRVGAQGKIVGVDLDDVRIEEASREAAAFPLSNVEFRVADIRKKTETPSEFDLIFSRFLIDHVAHPDDVFANMRDMLKPGGILIAECADYSGWYCYPALPAFDRALELLAELRRHTGGAYDFGAKLPVLLLGAGLADVEISVFQLMELAGPLKRWILSTLTGDRAEWMITLDLTTREEIERLLAEIRGHIENPRTVMGTPRFIQSWGYKP